MNSFLAKKKMISTIELKPQSILFAPLQNFPNDFTFIVNGEQFQTTKIIADLLSPKISNLHKADPTISEYIINTNSSGNFQNILDLLDFSQKTIQEINIPFITEVIDELSNENISIEIEEPEITIDNVVTLIERHEKLTFFSSDIFSKEIGFLSEHFNEIECKDFDKLLQMKEETLEKIIDNDKLNLDTEDQLLKFINLLYLKNDKYSKFYEFVLFENVEKQAMKEFISIFNIDHLTTGGWRSIMKAFTEGKQSKEQKCRYHRKSGKKVTEISMSGNNLKGIFNYFNTESNIKNEVSVTCSSHRHGDLYLLLDIENTKNKFFTYNESSSWVCFEFKNRAVIPSGYSIRSKNNSEGSCHPKSWVIECSDDKNDWVTIDEQNNCPFLNGSSFVHTFPIRNLENMKKEIKYIRMRMTGPNWYSSESLDMCSIEFYGQIM